MSEGVETGVLPGMGDLPVSPVPAGAGEERPAGRRRATKKGKREPAELLPIARVAVDMSLPHLDRPFDYLVPTTLDAAAVPGCRVRVRFAGQLMDGYLLERVDHTDHDGRLAFLERVTSPEPVLTPEIAALAREIADRYAGTLADVLRLAIPPRHARVEAENDTPKTPAGDTEDEPEAPPRSVVAAVGTPGPGGRVAETPPLRGREAGAAAPEGVPEPGDARSEPVAPPRPVVGKAAGPPPAEEEAGTQHSSGGGGTGPGGSDTAHGPAGRPETPPADGGETGTYAPPEATRSAAGEIAGAGPVPGSGAANVGMPGGGGEGTEASGAVSEATRSRAVAGGPAASSRPVAGAGPAGAVADAGTPAGHESEEAPGNGEDASRSGRAGGEVDASLAGPLRRQAAGGVPEGASARTTEPPSGFAGVTAAGGPGTPGTTAREAIEPGPWAAYPAGPSFLGALQERRAPRAVWSALPGADWTPAVARAAGAALAGGRGALIVVADGRDVARVDQALTAELGPGGHVALTAELGPAERYRRWLAVRRAKVRVVVGTRAAIFAPVKDLGLVVLWDDGDDVHAEPHAPYPHAREVLALRAHRAGAGALIGGFTRTTDATQLVQAGWAHPLTPDRERLRAAMAYIRPSGDDADLARDEAARSARLPHLAFRTARQGLEHGPVLVQVPRRGYVPALACSRCRGPARCTECEGPLSLRSSHAAPYCRWCGRIAGAWACPECGGRQVRAVVVGARRTAEELGRAFPGVPIRTSGRDGVLAEVGNEPALIVATPGAEPVAEKGYAAALLLDGWVLLGRADLRAGEEALRRWMNAAALVRSRGPVVVLADGALVPVQALIRWDAVTYAERELAERRELGFPPAVRMASLTGTPQSVRELVEAADLPKDAEVLGPVEVGEGQERALVRVERARGVALSRLLKTAQAARSTRKTADVVRVRVDPLELI
ncbi:primosomal protein N' [Actinomadura sp. DC4]|uniref:primosomal protein N' family DNA-binding protein n=1 Tax=Actinomadura sp. DC4 TaxID=3055069 RepID=UPI0025B1F078|nr:primosomal protein N' [Actinomadura sp. DC4]MDN3358400.1 primosomal protein N' [Actinomadura sp. DC4]